jgi:hypothetical protein
MYPGINAFQAKVPELPPTSEDELTVRPQDFFEGAPSRIIGTETEFNVQNPPGDDPDKNISTMAFVDRQTARLAGIAKSGDFMDNGMKAYLSCGLPEICSAEALGPRQAVATSMATLGVMARLVTASGKQHGGLYCPSGTTIGSESKSSGRHENYMIPRDVGAKGYIDTILPSLLASRLYAGSGAIGPDGFQIFQKARSVNDPPIARDNGRRTLYGNKPMVMIPIFTEDKAPGVDGFARFEVRMCDTNFSPFACYLGFAAVSLGLRLLEHRDKVDIEPLHVYAFEHPAAAAKDFSGDLTISAVAETRYRKFITAPDYNDMLIASFMKLDEEVALPADERAAIPLLAAVNDSLRKADLTLGEYDGLTSKLDFAARHRYIAGRLGSDELTSNNPRALQMSLIWDRVLPAGGGPVYWSKHAKAMERITSPQEIAYYELNPPATRAAARAELIRQADGATLFVDWHRVRQNSAWDYSLADSYQPLIGPNIFVPAPPMVAPAKPAA